LFGPFFFWLEEVRGTWLLEEKSLYFFECRYRTATR